MKRNFEKDNKHPLSEFQNKDSKTKSDLPSGASTNTKTIKNNFQLKRKISYSKQAKAKIQQNEIAPELQCNMNSIAMNNKCLTYIDEDGLDKKPILPELQYGMNMKAKIQQNHIYVAMRND